MAKTVGKFVTLETDFSGLLAGIRKVALNYDAKAKIGMRHAIQQHMNDALNEAPRVPQESGNLRGSHSVFVGNELVATSEGESLGGSPLRVLLEPSEIGKVVGTLVANQPYAASIHEGISRHGTPYTYKTPGTGAKWIEAKLTSGFEKYFNILASYLKS